MPENPRGKTKRMKGPIAWRGGNKTMVATSGKKGRKGISKVDVGYHGSARLTLSGEKGGEGKTDRKEGGKGGKNAGWKKENVKRRQKKKKENLRDDHKIIKRLVTKGDKNDTNRCLAKKKKKKSLEGMVVPLRRIGRE